MKENQHIVSSTYKSQDTEEWFDIVFNRPIGYRWALLFKRLGVHPNTVTVLSMFLGAAAGLMFYFDADTTKGFVLNLIGVLLLMWANFYDSADGQLARMTGQKTPLGRILDGASSDVWFLFIYLCISFRLYDKVMPLCTEQTWGLWIFALCSLAGFGAHTYECQLADYYRNIHLYFLKGTGGSEFDHYLQQKEKYDTMPLRGHVVEKVFQWFYVNYTHTQELATPQFQRLWKLLQQRYGGDIPQSFRDRFRTASLPLMKWTNILTFNTRAAVLYISCLCDEPWVYPVFELTVLLVIYLHMRYQHERFSRAFADELEGDSLAAVKGIILDYGGTIDTNAVHWSEVLWDGYQAAGIQVDKEVFRDAYVHGERTLAREPLIQPEHTMLDLLRIKVNTETRYLTENGLWETSEAERAEKSEAVARFCYEHVKKVLETSRAVLNRLAEHYPLVLVSNFYGNLNTVLKDFGINCFQTVIESAVVGVRKPDPQIFRLGTEALGLLPQQVVAIGDSYAKDVAPAASIGCKTIWLKGKGWNDEAADRQLPTAVIHDFATVRQLLFNDSHTNT